MHFVLVSERTQGGVLPLDAVRPAVRREWTNARRLEAEAALYRTLRARYRIVVEESPAARAKGSPRSRPMRRLLMLLSLAGLLVAPAARAHEVRPGYLELRQTAADTYDLLFKVPALGEEFRLALYVRLPEGTQDVARRARCSPAALTSNAVPSGAPAGWPGNPSPSRACRPHLPTCWCGSRT